MCQDEDQVYLTMNADMKSFTDWFSNFKKN